MRETKRDDIWKYQTSLRATLLLPLLIFKWQMKHSAVTYRMPFVHFWETGSHKDLHVVTLDYASHQNAPCQGHQTQAKSHFLGWAPRRCHNPAQPTGIRQLIKTHFLQIWGPGCTMLSSYNVWHCNGCCKGLKSLLLSWHPDYLYRPCLSRWRHHVLVVAAFPYNVSPRYAQIHYLQQ